MANLPLESSSEAAKSHDKPLYKERLSSLLSSAMMCGVLVHDGLFVRDYIILLVILFSVLMMVKGAYYRNYAAFALCAFVSTVARLFFVALVRFGSLLSASGLSSVCCTGAVSLLASGQVAHAMAPAVHGSLVDCRLLMLKSA